MGPPFSLLLLLLLPICCSDDDQPGPPTHTRVGRGEDGRGRRGCRLPYACVHLRIEGLVMMVNDLPCVSPVVVWCSGWLAGLCAWGSNIPPHKNRTRPRTNKRRPCWSSCEQASRRLLPKRRLGSQCLP